MYVWFVWDMNLFGNVAIISKAAVNLREHIFASWLTLAVSRHVVHADRLKVALTFP